MIWTELTELRQCINSNPQWPLPYDKWPKVLETSTNCLAFALGLNIPDKSYGRLVSINPKFPTPKFNTVFEELLDSLDLEWRKISDLENLLEGEYVLQIYGFYRSPAGREYHPDFHVIRRELDGTWVHKPDWKEAPCEIKFDDFAKEYPEAPSGIYAVKKKAR